MRVVNVVQGAKSAASRARPQVQAPFVCANCRRLASRPTSIAPHPGPTRPLSAAPQRSFSAAPIRREAAPGASAPKRESGLPQTHYDFFPETFPEGPPPRSPFTPDLRQLRKEYLTAQAKIHPDLAPADQKRQAEALSMRVNEAYKTLQDPLRRAQYLLSLRGIDVEDETAKLEGNGNALLMEVMEAREAVDEAEDETQLAALREENKGRIARSVDVLERAFADGAHDAAAEETVRLRYWMNIEESIRGWEQGSAQST